ncbi:hypothetical protein [Sphingomonas sp.]|uniref:hypothetical protein n=1 Tax=Sphingomonas sp. TaxID=28214 RepID=UPI0025CF195C|nr:hypothetical protein [Sphingomonas sp.]
MLTGRDALSTVERAISGARANENRLGEALQSATAEVARYIQAETDGFRALARAKLDAMAQNQIVGALDATERRALALIEGPRQTIAALGERQRKAQAALDTAEADRHDRGETLARALRALDDLRHAVSERVKNDAAWRAASDAVAAAQAVAANAEQKAATAEADLAEKGKPYENDPLFMYLWRRKHGQAEDRSGFLVRFFDRKVARLIGYGDARANYAMLREIPARLREHANAKQGDVETAKLAVVAVERQALVAAGVEPLEKAADDAQTAAAEADAVVTKATSDLQEIDRRRAEAAGVGENAAYDQAVELLTGALSREDIRRLFEEARRTPSPADDQAVSAIAAARDAQQKTNAEIAKIRAQISEMANRRSELEGARDRARRQGYDSPIGGFNDKVDLGSIIGGTFAAARSTIFSGAATASRRPAPTRISAAGAAGRHGRGRGSAAIQARSAVRSAAAAEAAAVAAEEAGAGAPAGVFEPSLRPSLCGVARGGAQEIGLCAERFERGDGVCGEPLQLLLRG